MAQLEKIWRSTATVSLRYDDNSAETFVLAVTKLLPSRIKITYADDKLPFFRCCLNSSDVTYHVIGNHKCTLLLLC